MGIVTKSNVLDWTKEYIDTTPSGAGVYVLRNLPSINGIIYIGYSTDLNKRLNEHFSLGDIPETSWFDWYQTDSVESAQLLEKKWIALYAPKYNQRIG